MRNYEEMTTMIVNYNTIKNMEVQLPVGNVLVMDLLHFWIKSYIKYMTDRCICSDEVLYSSIGYSSAKQALIAGLEERIKDEKILKHFVDYVSVDKHWKFEILKQRRGVKGAMIEIHGQAMYDKIVEHFGEDFIEY